MNKEKKIIEKWTSIRTILDRYVTSVIILRPTDIGKYNFDIESYIINELSIQEYAVLPHILVNGLDSSNCFSNNLKEFKLLDSGFLNHYNNLIRS